MPLTRRAAGLLVAMVLVGCNDPVVGRDPIEFDLSATEFWSGSSLILSAVGLETVPTVLLGGDTLLVERMDDVSHRVTLPHGDGSRVLRVETPDHPPFETTITLYGYEGVSLSPPLSGVLQLVPGLPVVIGNGDVGAVMYNVRTNAVLEEWPATIHSPDCAWSVGPSFHPGRYVLAGKDAAGQCGPIWTWQLIGSGLRVDSFPPLFEPWSLGHIPAGLVSGADDPLIFTSCDNGVCVRTTAMNSGGGLLGMTIGMTAGRVILHQFRSRVLDAFTGDTLYQVDSLASINDAVFSASEDTAFVVGYNERVVSLDPATGSVYGTFRMPGYELLGIARHPSRPWLLVAAIEGVGRPVEARTIHLLILEQSTLERVAELRSPEPPVFGGSHKVIIDELLGAVYVVTTQVGYDIHGASAKVLRFNLRP